jgi:hypothetical protein
MKTYIGFRNDEGAQVVVRLADGSLVELNPRNDWRNHSPDGFEWGYGGSGPAQLALAIVGDLYPRYIAERVYHNYKFAVIDSLKSDSWELHESDVRATVDQIMAKKGASA